MEKIEKVKIIKTKKCTEEGYKALCHINSGLYPFCVLIKDTTGEKNTVFRTRGEAEEFFEGGE